VIIRDAAPGDDVRIAELAAQLGYPCDARQVQGRPEKILADPAQRVLVAELADSGVVGWMQIFLYQVVQSDLRVEVAALVVDEACRCCGVGKALMGRAEEWARSRGCRAVSLRSNVVRQGAHDFYLALGYSILKTQHAFRKNLFQREE
jgi:GNAT superfamily N-acetyltransferase